MSSNRKSVSYINLAKVRSSLPWATAEPKQCSRETKCSALYLVLVGGWWSCRYCFALPPSRNGTLYTVCDCAFALCGSRELRCTGQLC